MSINAIFPQITMQLDETDAYELQQFLINAKLEGEFTEDFLIEHKDGLQDMTSLILYNFADDCRYSKCIQPELIQYLLPFYLKIMEQAILSKYKNGMAVDIYFHFNSAIFFNQKNFKYAIGEENYQYIMKYYINQTMKYMEMDNLGMLDWVSLFNTTVAFCKDNIVQLFKKIFRSSLKIKFSFFKYLSVLLFKESDNLLAVNELRAFWTSDIWNFDTQFSDGFFWNDDIVEYFDKEIDGETIKGLFQEIKPLLCDIFESELIELFSDEMKQSFDTGIFQKRKIEYLQKISCQSEQYKYWDSCF